MNNVDFCLFAYATHIVFFFWFALVVCARPRVHQPNAATFVLKLKCPLKRHSANCLFAKYFVDSRATTEIRVSLNIKIRRANHSPVQLSSVGLYCTVSETDTRTHTHNNCNETTLLNSTINFNCCMYFNTFLSSLNKWNKSEMRIKQSPN